MIETVAYTPHNLNLPKLHFSYLHSTPFPVVSVEMALPSHQGVSLLHQLVLLSSPHSMFHSLHCLLPNGLIHCCAVYHGGFILVLMNLFPS